MLWSSSTSAIVGMMAPKRFDRGTISVTPKPFDAQVTAEV
jgi:hypothetical protein